ncbi:MAG: energy transducer TonB [Bacteroidetes bacterium]|jgi:TonB family protein|nr:energy transducer TonB [Bacteroidota bacterium]
MKHYLLLLFTFSSSILFGQTDSLKACHCNTYNPRTINGQPVLTIVQKMPKFPGGDTQLSKFVKSNLKYPDNYDGWKGNVYVSFVVDTSGKVINPCVVRGQLNSVVLTENDKAALDVIRKLPPLEPGIQNSKKVNVDQLFVVKFSGKN